MSVDKIKNNADCVTREAQRCPVGVKSNCEGNLLYPFVVPVALFLIHCGEAQFNHQIIMVEMARDDLPH